MTQALLPRLLTTDPHAPRLVLHAAAGRTELSTASLANWSAKVAGLLVDELGAAPADRVILRLPAGWQTASILLGCWWAGAVVCWQPVPAEPADPADPAEPAGSADAIAAFVADPQWIGAQASDAPADEVFVVSGHPLGARSSIVAAHQRDFTEAVLPQADRFTGQQVGADAPAITTDSQTLAVGEVVARAQQVAESIGPDARLLHAADWSMPTVIDVLLGPLAAGGGLVQFAADSGISDVHSPDAARVFDAERCTHRWPLGGPGQPDTYRT